MWLIMWSLTNEVNCVKCCVLKRFIFYLIIISFRNELLILTWHGFQMGELKKKPELMGNPRFLNEHWYFVYSYLSLGFYYNNPSLFSLHQVWMTHWNAHLVCNWLHSQSAESFLFCPCDVGRPPRTFESETLWACSQPNKGNRLPRCMQVYE